MAVTTLYMSDRDPEKRTFTDKKEADALDKKLEFAENLRVFLETRIVGLDEEKAEEIGLLIADYKDEMITALKGKPEVLTNIGKESDNVKSIDAVKNAS
ncbi:YebG family protein [Alkalimarinus sediminis]|uniref:YebG family protein n=1 Tax=Alkalimarinus sediminis TaxID=1632866 RepID=A0A9E8HGM5_9ALTE|nr:YebG family protein [Alkalimarinus sediminis]UZW74308.1 YebG family protein [Alkalimarinus sediminis]